LNGYLATYLDVMMLEKVGALDASVCSFVESNNQSRFNATDSSQCAAGRQYTTVLEFNEGKQALTQRL
jgi:azurin